MATLTLTIRLGNAAASTGEDVGNILTRAGEYMAEYHPDELEPGNGLTLIDQNGNRVGEWKVTA